MRKKITLLLFILLVISASAKDRITTYDGPFANGKSIAATELAANDVISIDFTVAEANGIGIYYVTNTSDWNNTSHPLPSLTTEDSNTGYGKWHWKTETGTYSFTLTTEDINAMSGENTILFIGSADNEKITIAKVTQTRTLTPSSTTNIDNNEWTDDANWTGKSFDPVPSAKIGDVIKLSYTASGTYFQIHVMNYAKGTTFQNDAYSVSDGENYTYEYVIPDYETLKKIRTEGFALKGAGFTLTSIDLLTYSDSYGYITFTIGDTGYATWSSDKKYDFASAGLTAYYASAVALGTVTLTSMDITWDWQGYIIKGTEGNYDVIESLTTDGSYYPSTNYLKQCVNSSNIPASVAGTYHYIFAKQKEGEAKVGFYKLENDHTLTAHKAYLETPEDITPSETPSGGARGITLNFGDGTTAIFDVFHDETTLNTALEDNVYYTLQGTRVQNPSKGLYILNGKKVLVK